MNRWMFLPNAAVKDLRFLSNLSDEVVEKLKEALDSDTETASYALFLRIAQIVSIADQDAASFYYFWDYVQDQRKESRKSGADVINEFVSFLKSKPLGAEESKAQNLADIAKLIQDKREALASLFGDLPNKEHAQKIKALETGPLPHFTGIRTFCDLRPVFDKAGLKIRDFVPTIIMRLRTHGFPDEHKEVIVQLNENQLSSIEAELRRVRGKLEILRQRFPELAPEQKKKSKTKGA